MIINYAPLPGEPNNKERDKERNEYGDDAGHYESSGSQTLPRVISQPRPFLLQFIKVRF